MIRSGATPRRSYFFAAALRAAPPVFFAPADFAAGFAAEALAAGFLAAGFFAAGFLAAADFAAGFFAAAGLALDARAGFFAADLAAAGFFAAGFLAAADFAAGLAADFAAVERDAFAPEDFDADDLVPLDFEADDLDPVFFVAIFSNSFSLIDAAIGFDAPRSSLLGLSPRLADRIAPADWIVPATWRAFFSPCQRENEPAAEPVPRNTRALVTPKFSRA